MVLPSGLLLLLLLVASSLAAQNCGYLGVRIPNRHPRALIMGGNEIYGQDAPWVVRVDGPDGYFTCSGSLISDRHVITAAHCFTPENIKECRNVFETNKNYSICYKEGTNDRKCFKGRKYLIKEVLFMDRYMNSNCNATDDIAVLELHKPIESAIPVCLPIGNFPLNYESQADSEAHLIGYSHNWPFRGRIPGANTRLKHATTTVNVKTIFGVTALVSAYDDQAAICAGDSGGPMFEIHDRKAMLIGVNVDSQGHCAIDGVIPKIEDAKQRSIILKKHLDLIISTLRARGTELQ